MLHTTVKNNGLLLMLLLLMMMVSMPHLSLADFFEECNEAGGIDLFIASNKSCAHFIYCSGEDSFESVCPEEYDFFNAQQSMCEPMKDVDCRTGLPLNMPQEQQQETLVSLTTVNVISDTVTEMATLETITPANLPSGVITIVANYCPLTDNQKQIVLLPHDKSCTEYSICYHGKPLPMNCAANMHFNAKTGKCDKAEVVNCLRSTISVREQCKSHTVDIYPHPDNCNYFYYCRNGFLMLQQCPFFYGWDHEKRSCVAISRANCYRLSPTMKTNLI